MLRYGGDYNPEQWPRELWDEDIQLMIEARVNLVSVCVFGWGNIEKAQGVFDFGWLDDILGRLHAAAIDVNLATGVATPPSWLVEAHPEILPVTREGVRLSPGSRQHFCPSSPAYRRAASSFVSKMAERYSRHPAVVMWHVNNELGLHVNRCYCETSRREFQRWLQLKYESIEELNQAWTTVFWGQTYSDWRQIHLPGMSPTFMNPAQEIDFARFSTGALRELYDAERAILLDSSSSIPLTTNLPEGLFEPLDYWSWDLERDVVSLDCYPNPADSDAHIWAALQQDVARGLGRGAPWVLMEQITTHVSALSVNVAKPAGVMRLWSFQALARGADGVMFFQWRQSRGGAEQFTAGMVQPAGTEGRAWSDVVALGQELERLAGVEGSRLIGRVAVVLDWESIWALALPSRPSNAIQGLDQYRAFHRAFYKLNVAMDFVPPGASLTQYDVVIMPCSLMTTEAEVRAVRDAVWDGAVALVGPSSGIVDRSMTVPQGPFASIISPLTGVVIDEFRPCPEGFVGKIQCGPKSFQYFGWTERLRRVAQVEALGTYEGGELGGQPAWTRHQLGSGATHYLSTLPDEDLLLEVARRVCREAGIDTFEMEGIEVCERRTSDGELFRFVLNHGTTEVAVPAGATTNALVGTISGGQVVLGPSDVAVLSSRRRSRKA